MSIEAASRIESRRDVRDAEPIDERAEVVVTDPFPSKNLAAEPLAPDLLEITRPLAPTRLASPFSTPLTVDSPRLRRVFEREAGAHVTRGNLVAPLINGPSSFKQRKLDGATADHFIHLETFAFHSDAIGWEMAHLYAQKARAGRDVRIIYDAYGSLRTDPGIFAMMRYAGVQVRARPLQSLNRRWHRKIFLVDGKVAIVGGMNHGDPYAHGGESYWENGELKQGWRDSDMHVRGPALRDYQAAFLSDWNKLGGVVTEAQERELMRTPQSFANGVDMAVARSVPHKGESAATSDMLYYAFAAAQRSITLETPYLNLVPQSALLSALFDARARGVNVRALVPSRNALDHKIVHDMSDDSRRTMVDAGIQIRESPHMVHQKSAVVDRQLLITGSANLNGRSDRWDREIISAIWDRKSAEVFEQHFDAHLPVTHLVTPEDFKPRSISRRAFVFLANPFSSSF